MGSSHPDYGTHNVGTKQANELGIFDMSGNVWEWVWDIYGNYPSGSQNNPTGASSGSFRVLRGGSWDYNADYCTVSGRDVDDATVSNYNIGFRCVRVSP
jgi:formylglycine-generating enzyme required for sulfatase activity